MKPSGVTTEIKAVEQYFPVMLFIIYVQSGSNFEFVDETLMKAIEQYLPVVLYILL